jgi:hypothetical protein
MTTITADVGHVADYPVKIRLQPSLGERDRVSTAFRIFLALPHLLLVGGPIAAGFSWGWSAENGYSWGTGGGVLGGVAIVVAIIAWFAILFTGRYPRGLWDLAAFYLRWRVRAVSYVALLRDEYPPFGDGPYPASLQISAPDAPRDRLTVGFRLILAIPHVVAILVLDMAWALTTIIAWFAILFTGRYPAALYDFSAGVFRWNVRVEAYLLLLRDEYPPFSLE